MAYEIYSVRIFIIKFIGSNSNYKRRPIKPYLNIMITLQACRLKLGEYTQPSDKSSKLNVLLM